MALQIIPRKAWGAKAPTSRQTFSKPSFLFVHHTTGATLGKDKSDDWLRSIQNYHQKKKWADIGYSFAYDDYGQIFELRGWNVEGAHTQGYNSRSHAIVRLGNGDKPDTPAGLYALKSFVAEHDRRYGKVKILGHRDVDESHCPGNSTYSRIGKLRDGFIKKVVKKVVVKTRGPKWSGRYLKLRTPLMRGDDVRWVQEDIARMGYRFKTSKLSNGKFDGIAGREFDAAVRWAQRKFGFKGKAIDGIVGPATWARLVKV